MAERRTSIGGGSLSPRHKADAKRFGKKLSKDLGLQGRDAGVFKSIDHNVPYTYTSDKTTVDKGWITDDYSRTRIQEQLVGLSGKWQGGVADPTKLFSASYEGTDDPYYLFKAQGASITGTYRGSYYTEKYSKTGNVKWGRKEDSGSYRTDRTVNIERDHTTRESMLDYERSARTAYASSFFQEF